MREDFSDITVFMNGEEAVHNTDPIMGFLISDAWAQAEGAGGSGLIGILPMVLIFVVFYFLLIRPQQKRAKEHRNMVAALSKGDEVVTNGGTLGKITDVDDSFVTLEIAPEINIRVQRAAISQMMPKGTVKS